MSQPKWISEEELAITLNDCARGLLVIDVRPLREYNERHVVGSLCLGLPPMLVRRLANGLISLDALITDQEMLSAFLGATNIVLYDSNSNESSTRDEFIKLTKILMARVSSTGALIKLLNGGMTAFSKNYPNLCCSSKESTSSPLSISLDTSAIKAQEVAAPVGTPNEILPHLFLGSALDATDYRVIQQLNITAILNITTHCPNLFESQLTYMRIYAEDSLSADLLSKLHHAISYIDAVKLNGGKVLVHCYAGISRSATICIAYVMQSQNMSLEDAYKFVKSKRPIVSPNLNFMGQLMEYQKSLLM